MNEELKNEYDRRYRADYRSLLQGYEVARWEALEHFFRRGPGRVALGASRVLDYGAGSGLFSPLWEALFPEADLDLCDISSVAGELYLKRGGKGQYGIIENGRTPYAENTFDLVVSVEVMEHVEELSSFLSEIFRILKPGGSFVWTTPCANSLSVEHLYALMTRQQESSATGERRWKWEDSGHLRRLKSREAAEALERTGFERPVFRYRAHLFSFWATRGLKFLSEKGRERVMTLDYRWLRALPNGASMIGKAKKPTLREPSGGNRAG